MANLTKTTYYTRKILKYGSTFLVTFLLIRGIVLAGIKYWKIKHPPPPPPPTMCFGKIPAIKFPEKGPIPPFYPRLETIDNRLPSFPPTAKVYFIPQQTSSLFTWDRAKNWARQLGFLGEPEQPDEYTFVYKTQTLPQTILRMNVLNGNFNLTYDYQNDLTLVGIRSAPNKDQAIAEAKAFLQKAGVLTPDLAAGNQEVIHLKFNPPDLEPAVALSEADFALVNFFRGNLEGIKILPPNPKKSLVSVLLSGSAEQEKRVLEVNYIHFLIGESDSCTYPLKPIDQAWEELKENKTFLASFGQNYDGQVVVRKVSLAYFDPPDEQRFLEPIYVFEADRDFIAYVSALDPKLTE